MINPEIFKVGRDIVGASEVSLARWFDELAGRFNPINLEDMRTAEMLLYHGNPVHLSVDDNEWRDKRSSTARVMLHMSRDEGGAVVGQFVPGMHMVTGGGTRIGPGEMGDQLEHFMSILSTGFEGKVDPNVYLLTNRWWWEAVNLGIAGRDDRLHPFVSRNEHTELDTMRILMFRGFRGWFSSVSIHEYPKEEFILNCPIEAMMSVAVVAEDSDPNQRREVYERAYMEELNRSGRIAPMTVCKPGGEVILEMSGTV